MIILEAKRQLIGIRPLSFMFSAMALSLISASGKYFAVLSGLEFYDGFDIMRACLPAFLVFIPGSIGAMESSLTFGRDWKSGMIRTRALGNISRIQYAGAKSLATFIRQTIMWIVCAAPIFIVAFSLGLGSTRIEDAFLGKRDIVERLAILLAVSFFAQQLASALGLFICMLVRGRSFLSTILAVSVFCFSPLFLLEKVIAAGIGRLMYTGILGPSAWIFGISSLCFLAGFVILILMIGIFYFLRMDITDHS